MSQLGRLPPLQTIGRSVCVDVDEPPDLSDTEIDRFLDAYNNKPLVYIYNREHATVATSVLTNHFRLLSPGDHLCKRIPEAATGFTHSRHSVAFAVKYAELRHMLQTQADLEFVRDYTSRINAASVLVTDLEAVVAEEYTTWYNICHNCLSGVPTTKLECLSAICEDLRVHMNHWNSIKQLLYTDPWLKAKMPTLVLQVGQIRTRLYQLRDRALWWMDKLVQVGFRVMAHCDLERMTSDALWGITRGLEEFNSIASAVKCDGNIVEACNTSKCSSKMLSHTLFNSFLNEGDSIKPIPFSRVLNLLASERSRFAAATTHQFFTGCRDLLHLALSRKGLGSYRWEDSAHSKSSTSGTNTSDYHTATGSHVSLGTAMLIVGGVTAPDLSREASPLMDFARREKTFAHKFLQIVFNSTSLLKRHLGTASTTKSFKKGETPPLGNHSNTNTPNLPPRGSRRKSEHKDRLDPDGPELSRKGSLSRSDPKRKSVSWSDASEVPVIQQLIQRYLDILWQHFGGSVLDQATQPVWGSPDEVRGQMGSLIMCSDLMLHVLIRMIQHTCAKDIFPVAAASALTVIAERVTIVTAWRAWDTAMCRVLASAAVDKGHPVLLEAGEHSTHTAKCLRDAYQPLHSALALLQNNSGSASKSPLSLAAPTLQRLLMTCEVTTQWCDTRGLLYLGSWALGAFLLVSQSDLKLLGDEMRRGIADCQGLCGCQGNEGENTLQKSSSQTRGQSQLENPQTQLEVLGAQLQSLSGTLVKQFSEKCHGLAVEYFDEEMPMGKMWKRRQPPERPLAPNPYTENALDTLLEPIIAGANKLNPTSQLSVVSMATTAMCEAWTEVILQRKIKFSVQGAQQLEQDFRLVQTWLENYVQNPEVRAGVLDGDIFKYLAGIVDVLKRQPRGRSASRPPEQRAKAEESSTGSCNVSVGTSSSDPWTSDSSTAAPQGDSACHHGNDYGKLTNHNGETAMSDTELSENFKVPKIEQWLALRVHGGARNWKLPSCFNNAHS